ncbi:hypothetical protein R1flu_006637 [Riccia fluitans]|uniref:SAP domain-containing protein n=1 Tax=Riccia fluitans TaxID=41844 RepID=A0ABD1YWT4_9MARC
MYVDCRFDSSRSRYHGTLPVINIEDDKVIEMVILTQKETGSSWRIKTQALQQVLSTLHEKGLNIVEVIHDDNTQVDAILCQHNILSQKDLWHKCKNVMGKFTELLEEKRRTPQDSTVEASTTIAQVVVFSIAQLKDYCRENNLQQTGSKLCLVQRVSVHLKLPEAGASTELQLQRPLKYPELATHDLAYKLKSWIYTCVKNAALRGDTTPELLTMDIHNAADYWAGDHSTCRKLPGVQKCIVENWSGEQKCKYAPGGETHKVVKEFLKKYITESKMKCYIRARENFISETFHSIINKFATKHIYFDSSHIACLACATMDWNENIKRDVRAIYQHSSNDTAVRSRVKTNRYLADKTSCWKRALGCSVFG